MLSEITHPQQEATGRIRRFCGHFFWVDDPQESIRFYRDMMGFSLAYQEPRFVSMKTGNLEICFQSGPRSAAQPPAGESRVAITVEVDDVWAFYRRLRNRSVAATEPRTQEWDRAVLMTEFTDMNGIHWALVQPQA